MGMLIHETVKSLINARVLNPLNHFGFVNELKYFLPEKGLIIICGKGGVGKTTFSALYALFSSSLGIKTFVTSIDPAHHLGNVLGVRLGHEPMLVMDNLYANEVDIDLLIKEYIDRTVRVIRNVYTEVQVFNFDKYVEMLKESPGVEEDALFSYLMELRKYDYPVTIVDTPATSITTRVLKLPWLQSLWLDRLIELRSKIIGYKEVLESISQGRKVRIRDAMLEELIRMHGEVEEYKSLMTDHNKTKLIFVVTAEELPILELRRFVNAMGRVNVRIQGIVLNRYVDNESNNKRLNQLREEYREVPIIIVPYSENVIGVENLMKLLNKIRVVW